MLHDLLDLNILRYITFRAAMAAVTAFVIGIAVGPFLIAFLKKHKIGEKGDKGDCKTLDDLQKWKRGTPTMGGVLIIGAALASTLLFARLDAFFVQVGIFAMLALGGLGAVDDVAKLTTGGKGLSARAKIRVQLAIGLAIGLALQAHYAFVDQKALAESFMLGEDEQAAAAARSLPANIVQGTAIYLPFAKNVAIGLGIGYAAFAAFVIVGTSNAVNLTDGLDGLAAGTSSFVLITFVGIAYVVGRADFSSYLHMPFVPGAGEAAVLGSAMLGATLAFLWFNAFPAEVFMGDTGSLALGGTIGVLALAVKQELLLVLAGGLFVYEALSVLIQVAYFKRTGKRVFRCAPVHHHYQLGGMFETQVTIRFWIVGAILMTLALATMKVR